MKAIVVYESHWGNTAAIAHAIAEGIGPAERFIVAGAYGPLRDGELKRARQWGTELAQALRAGAPLPI